MTFFVKLKDLKPGDMSVKKMVDWPGAEDAMWQVLKKHIALPPECWGVSVMVEIQVDCIVPPIDA